MENKTKEEIGQGTAMTKEDFAALWKTIRLKVTDTYLMKYRPKFFG